MKTIQLLKTAGSIACVAFALNATNAMAQSSAPSAASETIGQHVDDGTITTKAKGRPAGPRRTSSRRIST
ncbi:hypothetical protein ACFFYR_29890 [Paraburkholderia dipogonis]|uniref:hypothetical protein n=1 Tax=Paraburkholderia dipogonis TaxID=1211383 RepID=UPI0035E71BA6